MRISSRNGIWRLVFVLFLGQLASLCIAVASFTSSYIADLGVDAPLTQCMFGYLSLAVVYGCTFLFRHQKLLVPWYWYIILAIVDVQGNYLVVKAYQYSSITSVTLLDCWTIPWVMILTWYTLRTRYSLWQFLGATICVLGLVLVVLSDSGISIGDGRNPLLGDTLVIAGTLCYALSNVGEIALFAGFAVATFLLSTVIPFILKMSGATLFNLSLLSSDVWAVLIRFFFYQQQVDWLYYIAFAVVAIGLIIYSLNDVTSGTATIVVDDEANIQYEPLPDESS